MGANKQEIASLLSGFSIEVTPTSASKVNSFAETHFQIAQIEFSMKNRGSALKSIESAILASPKNLKYQNFRDIISPS